MIDLSSIRVPGLLGATILALLLPAAGLAQVTVPRADRDIPRFIIGGDLAITQPKGELAGYISSGGGLSFSALVRLERQGLLFARFEGGGAIYGTDTRRFSYAFRSFELETNNEIQWFSVGPEVMVPGGPLRPYVGAAYSLTRFRTSSTITERSTNEEYDSVDHASDFTTGWVFGGGFYIPFGSRSSFAAKIGAKYHIGGEANFVREEDVRDARIEADTFPMSRSKADFVLWQIGITWRIPRMTGGGTTTQ
jgi:opacity protein-like surface antigen